MGVAVDADSYLCSPLVPSQPEPRAQGDIHGLPSPGELNDVSSPKANAHQLYPPRLTGDEH